jgi:glycosyltransferase involved in cell wall biosynthesis
MKIHICGTRGIPNNYGGFEQCAEKLAELLADTGHDLTVYNPHYHSYKETTLGKIKISHQSNPEHSIGTLGNFIYDYRCMQAAYKANADVVLVLGYTTASIFFPFLRNKRSVLITNMDGLEWKRDKWNFVVKKIAKWLEKLGAKYSDYLVSDNRQIQKYLLEEYQRDSSFIAYGAKVFTNPDENILKEYNCNAGNYDMLIARFEKENNIEMILDGVTTSTKPLNILVIGKHETTYGIYLKNKYRNFPNIRFTGGIYNLNHLNNLRYYSRFYFHGHSVGGTNPSLLEAMASSAYIIAHDNPFNRDVLEENANYFSTPAMISNYLNTAETTLEMRKEFINGNLRKIEAQYNWKLIANSHEKLFRQAIAAIK